MGRRANDPIVDMLQEQMTVRLRQAALAAVIAPKTGWGRRVDSFRIRARGNWPEWIFLTLAVALGVGGIVQVIVGLSAVSKDPLYPTILVTAATALSFTSIVLTAFTLPQTMAAAIAPGFGAEVLSRKMPWLVGLLQILLSAGLFALAGNQPSQATAIGGALAATAGMAASWYVSRLLLHSADLVQLAQRQTEFIRAGLRIAVRQNHRMARRFIPKSERTPERLELLTLEQDLGYLNGFLRHMRSGMSSVLRAGQPQLVPTFWDAMLDMFGDFAVQTRGKVGGYDGPIAVIASALTQIVQSAMADKGEQDAMAVYCVGRVARLEIPEATSGEYEIVAQRLAPALTALLDLTWSEEWSQLPGSIASVEVELYKRALDNDALDTASEWGRLARAAIVRARRESQLPIAANTANQYVEALRSLLAIASHEDRTAALRDFFSLAGDLAAIPATSTVGGPSDSLALFLPGARLGHGGIQSIVHDIRSPVQIQRLVSALEDTFDLAVPSPRDDEDRWRTLAVDGLELGYSLTLHGALLDVSTDTDVLLVEPLIAAAKHSDVASTKSLLRREVIDLVWSIAVVQASVRQDTDYLRRTSRSILDAIDFRPLAAKLSTFQAVAVEGLAIVADELAVKTSAQSDLRSPASLQGSTSLPRCLAVKHDIAHDRRVTLNAEAWLLTAFPDLTAPRDADPI